MSEPIDLAPPSAKQAGARSIGELRRDADAASPAVDFAAGVVTCVVVWMVFLPFAVIQIDTFHDGLMLKPAMDVVSGQTLFRDSLMMYGPLTTWLQASAMTLLGPTLYTLRLTAVVAYGLAAGSLMVCWRLVLPRSLAILAAGLWLLLSPVGVVFHPWPSVYALCFQAMALLALMRALSSSAGRGWALASGVLAGLTLLSRQLPTGVLTCAGVLAALVAVALLFPARRRRAIDSVLSAGAGMALVVVAFLVHLLLHGSLDEWWQQTIVWAWRWSQAKTSTAVGLGALRALDPWLSYGLVFGGFSVLALLLVRVRHRLTRVLGIAVAALWLPFVMWFGYAEAFGVGIGPIVLVLAFAVALWIAWRDRGAPRDETVLALSALIVSLGSWAQAYPLGDPGHLFWGIGLCYGFAVFAAWQLSGRRTTLVLAVLLLLWSPFAVGKVKQWRERLGAPYVTLTEPPLLAGMRVSPESAAYWQRLSDALGQYTRTRERWAMLLEGNNLVAVSLAPDLTNSDPNYFRFLHVPYDDARRAQFILRERPLVFYERPAGELVQQAMAVVRYRSLINLAGANVLAPRAESAPATGADDPQFW